MARIQTLAANDFNASYIDLDPDTPIPSIEVDDFIHCGRSDDEKEEEDSDSDTDDEAQNGNYEAHLAAKHAKWLEMREAVRKICKKKQREYRRNGITIVNKPTKNDKKKAKTNGHGTKGFPLSSTKPKLNLITALQRKLLAPKSKDVKGSGVVNIPARKIILNLRSNFLGDK